MNYTEMFQEAAKGLKAAGEILFEGEAEAHTDMRRQFYYGNFATALQCVSGWEISIRKPLEPDEETIAGLQ